ncbi:MAG TPA: nicotinamide riboside transporter PnuC [Gammaproteobacteria bacterium]|nr:nicotinamide riboside transporter PnuC [Gammaproteobacteria bacterium]
MIDALRSVSWLEAGAVAFGVLYLVLAIRQNILCWLAGLMSSLLSVALLYEARLYGESALNIFYTAMSVYGWLQWRAGRGPGHDAELPVCTWPASTHAAAIGATLAASAALGWAMSHTPAQFPYVDAWVTVASLVTTYMVAKKVLENWVYWFVIDGLSAYLAHARGLPLYATLYVFYVVVVVIGFYRWHRDWRAQPALVA